MTQRLAIALLFIAVSVPLAHSQSTAASDDLFQRSDSTAAISAAREVLLKHPKDIEANFVLMEAASLHDDASSVFAAAIRIVSEASDDDPRREIAIARIRSLASNSEAFREHAQELRRLASKEPLLRVAFVNAAEDGSDQYEVLAESREAGLITDWRVAGPFGDRGNLDFQRRWAPETDGLQKPTSGRKRVENLQFPAGLFSLPAYFPRQGVFYAAGVIYADSTADWNIFFETPGKATLTLDGQQVIAASGAGTPRTERLTLHLKQGDHRVLVKFTSAAAPFRVALLPVSGGQRRKKKFPIATSTESDYVQASLQYWRGDLIDALRRTQALVKQQPSALVDHLIAEIWRAAAEDSPEAIDADRKAADRDPSAVAPLLAIANEEFESEIFESSLRHLRRALNVQSRSERALELQASIMTRLRWQSDATAAYQRWLEIHPSCRALQKAASYFSSIHDFGRASAAEAHLEGCSPDSTAFAETLAERGRHQQAARAARKIADRFPLNRPARELEIRELLLSRDFAVAQRRAEALVALAPSMSSAYRFLAQARARTEFPSDQDSRDWLDAHLAPLRRPFDSAVQQASKLNLSGSAVLLLNDEAVIEHNGERWHYRHRITKLNTRDAIVGRSEISLPSGATVLALRTISPDGGSQEPELSPHKATISMPALAPGSMIEEEYLWRGALGTDYRFPLGSFDLPIGLSRFSLISDSGLSATAERGAPRVSVQRQQDGTEVRWWENNAIAQTLREDGMPSSPALPAVLVTSGERSLTAQRLDLAEGLLEAATPGVRTTLLADSLRSEDELQTARRVYRTIIDRVRAENENATNASSAEDSLAESEGSRAAVLLALAQRAKVHVELFGARRYSDPDTPSSYSHLVAVFSFRDGRQQIADLENNGLPLGVISPEIARNAALPIISADSRGLHVSEGPLQALPDPSWGEESLATGNLTIDEKGTLRASVDITMAPWRGSQVRESLQTMSANGRRSYFQQLASRLFPGCDDAQGSSTNEDTPDRLLRLHVDCTAQDFVEVRSGATELSPLMPPLSLKSLYGNSVKRRFPLYIGSVLDETTDFTLRLPEGMELNAAFRNNLQSAFGTYSYSISRTDERTWRLVRSFRVPIQRVTPERYPEFASFAAQSDKIEQAPLQVLSR